MKDASGLTTKQLNFCLEYLKDFNGARAYRAAYPSCKTESSATSSSSTLLTNPKVKKYIDERIEELKSSKIMDVSEILERYTAIARGEDSEEVVTASGMKVEKNTSVRDKLKALEHLGKYHALFTDKINANINGSIVVLGGDEELE